MFRIITLKQKKFSQSDPVLIRPKLSSVLIQSDLVLLISIAWYDSGKVCTLAAQAFESRQSGALTRMKVLPGTTLTKRTCNRCGSLEKRGDVVATSRVALHWKCSFHMPSTWKWPEMKMYLDLNLAAFQYNDGFGCYHFYWNRSGLELMIFFWNSSQLSVQLRDCRLL